MATAADSERVVGGAIGVDHLAAHHDVDGQRVEQVRTNELVDINSNQKHNYPIIQYHESGPYE